MNDNDKRRFWSKVATGAADACWLWTAARLVQWGYGAIRVDGRTLRAHRVAWELTKGPIPNGLNVLHRCDNPACVNPAHLFLGTVGDNNADMKRKGRMIVPPPRYGAKHHATRLTAEQVREIRAALGAGRAVLAVARSYGMSEGAIASIRSGKSWGWLQ